MSDTAAPKFEWNTATVIAAADGELNNMERWPEEFFDAVLQTLEHRMVCYQKRDIVNGNIDAPALYAARAKTLGWLKTWWFHPPTKPSIILPPKPGIIKR